MEAAEGGVVPSPSGLLANDKLRLQHMEIQIRKLKIANANFRVANDSLRKKVKIYKKDFGRVFGKCVEIIEVQDDFKEKVLERIQQKQQDEHLRQCDCWTDERAFWAEKAGV
jgi:hypothetical protein